MNRFDAWLDHQTPFVRGVVCTILLLWMVGGTVCFTLAVFR